MDDRIADLRKRRLLASLAALGLILLAAGAGWLLVDAAGRARSAQQGATAPTARVSEMLEAARQHLRADDLEKAELLLRDIATRAPDDYEVWSLLGETLLSRGRTREAYEAYANAAAAPAAPVELEFNAGTVANTAGLTAEALNHYQRASARKPNDPRFALYLAQIQRKLGDTVGAKASLLRAANLRPDMAVAWGVLADIALQENNLTIARQHVDRARDLEPDNAQWRLIEARVLRRQNDPQAAARLLLAMPDDRLLGDPALVDEAASSLAMLGEVDEAASLYLRAADRLAQNAEVNYKAALMLRRAGRVDDALVLADVAAGLGSAPARDLAASIRAGQTP
ncbi:MAG: tetratricopeptide repeat protein [Phycisphaerales bacterium]